MSALHTLFLPELADVVAVPVACDSSVDNNVPEDRLKPQVWTWEVQIWLWMRES